MIDKKIAHTNKEIFIKAINFQKKGNISEASKIYQSLIKIGFINPFLYFNYGLILFNGGKLVQAEKCFLKTIEIKPDFLNAYFYIINILLKLQKFSKAEIFARKTIVLNPNSFESHANLGGILKELGKLKEAEISTRKAINLKNDFAPAHYNLGIILSKLGKLEESEISFLKAIEINPDFYNAQYSLGIVFTNLGKLKEAEISFLKAIEINPDYAKAYFSLSSLNYSDDNNWKKYLFSKNILKNQSRSDLVDIYFARANICHKEKNYKESSKFLISANELKLKIQPSNREMLYKKSKKLLLECKNKKINRKSSAKSPECIFIVGMPRSGSTLIENILSMNPKVTPLGEVNILEESFKNYKKDIEGLPLNEIYLKKISGLGDINMITTNKNLGNYKYAGIIANEMPNAKIIHCFRNPLDNILSMFRANFKSGINYSSSIVDCALIYNNQEEIMDNYKMEFRSKIYDLNYDLLVENPTKEVESLINWLGWKWNKSYLSPHLSERSVLTASSVEVRSPINSRSKKGWKNYKKMLNPAIKIITQNKKYKKLLEE